MKKQERLNRACKDASGRGVGWQGVVNKDSTVTLRREEEFANSSDINFETLEAALARLAKAREE